MARAKRSRPEWGISPIHPDAAAIDIGARMHVAAVPPDRDAEPVRRFGSSPAICNAWRTGSSAVG
mgnify:CR=1 FL=1